jgi:hypothetical protein
MEKFQKLSRVEMKNIRGGIAMTHCSFSGCSDLSGAPTESYDSSGDDGTIVATNFQIAADKWCRSNDCCTDADCPGAI